MRDGDENDPRSFIDDESKMRVLKWSLGEFKERSFNFNLMDGYDRISKVCDASRREDTGLGNILVWINKHTELVSGANRDVDCDFVSTNGCLYYVTKSLYEYQQDWCIGATKFKGTIYLYKLTTKQRRSNDANRNPAHDAAVYGGFRFEKMVSKRATTGRQEKDESHGDFYVVNYASINGKKLLYASQVPCFTEQADNCNLNSSNFVHLKASSSTGDVRKSRMIRWWSQSYLSGAAGILVGKRDPDFHVRDISFIRTDDMPSLCQNHWSSDEALIFLDRFLTFVKRTVVENNPYFMYEFSYRPRADFVMATEAKAVKTNRRVLPEWYINQS